MARKRDREAFGAKSLPQFLAEQAGDAAVVTIAKVDEQEMQKSGGRKRMALVITTEEYPANPWTVNVGDTDTLFDRLGDDLDDFVGEKVPMVRVTVNNPTTGQMEEKFHAAPADQWDGLLGRAAKKPAKRGR